jgi:hypothetical protein
MLQTKSSIFSNAVFFYGLCSIPIFFLIGNAAINIFSIIFFFLIFNFNQKDIKLFYKENCLIVIVIFIYLVYLFFNSLFNNYDGADLSKNLKVVLSAIRFFIVFLIIQIYLQRIGLKRINQIFKIWFLIFLFLIFDTLFQFIFGYNLIGIKSEFVFPSNCNDFSIMYFFLNDNRTECVPYLNTLRLSSFFGNEKIIGSFLLHFSPFAILTYIFIYPAKKNYFLLILYFLLLTVFWSGERMSFILLASAVFLFFILFFKLFNWKLLLIFFFCVILSLYFSYKKNDKISNRYEETIYISKKALNNEINLPYISIWKRAFDNFKKNKLFGSGINSFRSCYYKEDNKDGWLITIKPEILNKYGKQSCTTHSHNLYVHILSETGLVGISLFLMILYSVLLKIKKNYSKSKNKTMIKASMICIFILFFPLKTSGQIFSTFYGSMFFYLFSISYFFSSVQKRFL